MKKRVDKKNLWALGCFLSLFGFYIFSALTTSPPNPEDPMQDQIKAENLKRGYVELFVGGTPLYVPLRYLPENLFHVNNEVGTLILYFSYPGLDPITDDTGPIYLDIQRKKENYIGDERTLRDVWKVDPVGIPGPYGLTLHPVRKGSEHLIPSLKVYSSFLENGNRVILSCLEGVCTNRFYRGFDKVDIYYRFFERNLHDWQKIHEFLVGITEGFLSGKAIEEP